MQQLWTVLGPDGSKYVIWLGVGLALVLGVALVIWLLMKIFGRSLNVGGGNSRGQQQRLGITGAFNVDRKGRKLVIVRRDNVEHLILIGGPNDVLVESSIIRAERGTRPLAVAADGEAPTLAASQPVPAPPVVAAPQLAPKPAAPQPAPALPPQTRRDAPPLAAPAPQMAAAPVVIAPPASRPAPMPAAPQPVVEPPRAPVPVPAPPVEIKTAEPIEITSAPSEPMDPPAPRPVTDPRLSDMARRLQSVLQRPMTPASRPAQVDPAAASIAETKPLPLPSARKPDVTPEPEAPVAVKPPKAPKAAAPEAETPVTQGKDLPLSPIAADPLAIDSLEEEMARLLGRPGPGKP